jgi:hypothetical protein
MLVLLTIIQIHMTSIQSPVPRTVAKCHLNLQLLVSYTVDWDHHCINYIIIPQLCSRKITAFWDLILFSLTDMYLSTKQHSVTSRKTFIILRTRKLIISENYKTSCKISTMKEVGRSYCMYMKSTNFVLSASQMNWKCRKLNIQIPISQNCKEELLLINLPACISHSYNLHMYVPQLSHSLTHSIEWSPFWEGASWPSTQNFPNISWNLKVNYHVHRSLPLALILCQMNPVQPILFF